MAEPKAAESDFSSEDSGADLSGSTKTKNNTNNNNKNDKSKSKNPRWLAARAVGFWKSSFLSLQSRVRHSLSHQPVSLPCWGISGHSCYLKVKHKGETYAVLVGKTIEDAAYAFRVRRDKKTQKKFFSPLSGGEETESLPDLVTRERTFLFEAVKNFVGEKSAAAPPEQLEALVGGLLENGKDCSNAFVGEHLANGKDVHVTDLPEHISVTSSDVSEENDSLLFSPFPAAAAPEKTVSLPFSENKKVSAGERKRETAAADCAFFPRDHTQLNGKEHSADVLVSEKQREENSTSQANNNKKRKEEEEKEKEEEEEVIKSTASDPKLVAEITAIRHALCTMQTNCDSLLSEKTELNRIVHNLSNEQSQLREQYETMQSTQLAVVEKMQSDVRVCFAEFASAFTAMRYEINAQITAERANQMTETLQTIKESQRLREEVTQLTDALKDLQEHVSKMLAIVDTREGEIRALQKSKTTNFAKDGISESEWFTNYSSNNNNDSNNNVWRPYQPHKGDVEEDDEDENEDKKKTENEKREKNDGDKSSFDKDDYFCHPVGHVSYHLHRNDNALPVDCNQIEKDEKKKNESADISKSKTLLSSSHPCGKVNSARRSKNSFPSAPKSPNPVISPIISLICNDIVSGADEKKHKKHKSVNARSEPECEWENPKNMRIGLNSVHPYNELSHHNFIHEMVYVNKTEASAPGYTLAKREEREEKKTDESEKVKYSARSVFGSRESAHKTPRRRHLSCDSQRNKKRAALRRQIKELEMKMLVLPPE